MEANKKNKSNLEVVNQKEFQPHPELTPPTRGWSGLHRNQHLPKVQGLRGKV
jgi:hypothetical protein